MSQEPFFEALWEGEGIGDGGDVNEALLSYAAVQDDDLSWEEAIRRASAPLHQALPLLRGVPRQRR